MRRADEVGRGAASALAAAISLNGCGGGMLGGPPAGSPPSDANCASIVEPLVREVPEVLVLVDHAAPASLTAVLAEVVSATTARVAWGLEVFGDPNGSCNLGEGVVVTPGSDKAGAIVAALDGLGGGASGPGPSPVRAAEADAASYLAGRGDESPKYILLASDGSPSCLPGSADLGADDSAGAAAEIGAAMTAGTPTFVVGPTAPAPHADATLAAMATAGGEPPSDGTLYFSPATAADLEAAFETRVAAACAFTLGAPPNNNVSTDYIDIFADGARIPKDTGHSEGWDYIDATHQAIQIYGSTCDAINSGSVMKLTATYACLL
jgi:hypothetical protein